jgi:hypothetical protein
MPVSTFVRDANGEFATHLVGQSQGHISLDDGEIFTKFLGDNGCNEVMKGLFNKTFDSQTDLERYINHLVDLQKPVMHTIHHVVQNWFVLSRKMRIEAMWLHMVISVSHLVHRDIDFVYNSWVATGFNLNMRWDHDNWVWVEMSP